MSNHTPADFVSVDFESYYDKEYSLKNMCAWNYVYHPKFDAYQVALFGEGLRWVGHPKDADWSLVKGKIVVMHNAGFDALVYRRLQELGVIPADATLDPMSVWDTIDMVGYLGMDKRNLANSAKVLLNLSMSKAVRSQMEGKTRKDAELAGMGQALDDYGCFDAEVAWRLATTFVDQWPESERILSNLNRESGFYGVAVDVERVTAALKALTRIHEAALEALPWVAEGEKPLSAPAVRTWGRREGIPVPASLAKSNPEVLEWEATYADKYPWVKAVREYRSVHIILAKVQSMYDNLRPDGTMPFQIKYHGAGPGRFSGGSSHEDESGGKFNMLNLNREPIFGVDMRRNIKARPGHKLIVADYAQIEARLLLWAARDTELLDMIVATGGNVYQAYATKTGFFKGTGSFKAADPNGYRYIKASVLGLGYYCGGERFESVANSPAYNLGLTRAQADEAVRVYRAENPKVVAYWKDHQAWLHVSANHKDPTHEVLLPSGRVLTYWDPQFITKLDKKTNKPRREVVVRKQRDGNLCKCHGGVLTENAIQATGRDVLCDAWRTTAAVGIRTLWTVYDEFVFEAPENEAEDTAREAVRLMVSSSPWVCEPAEIRFSAPGRDGSVEVAVVPKPGGCPLGVEYKIVDNYCK